MNSTKQYGGKAHSLFILQNLGLNVPPFIAIKSDDPTLKNADLLHKKLNNLPGEYFAIRSSANVEDGMVHSFAGIFATRLFVAKSEILLAIKEVSESLHSEQLLAYTQSHGIDRKSIHLHIVIQVMIDADVSGVAFSIDPNKPYTLSPLINAAQGLGEPLVNGTISAEEFRLVNEKWQIKKGSQSEKLIHDRRKGLMTKSISPTDTPALTESQCQQLHQIILTIKKHFGQEVDIEFCYSNDQLYILQARPITAIRKVSNHIIWDNSNIVESYPGITSPFTFSFILPIYSSVYRNFSALLGVPKNVIEANSSIFDHMLGHLKGRIYYHLINWYKALSLLPAYQINKSFMEKMMGVSSTIQVPIETNNPNPKWKNGLYLFRTVLRLIKLNKTLPKMKIQFKAEVGNVINEYKYKDYTACTVSTIWRDYMEFKNLLVHNWNAPLVNDFFAMIYFGLLSKLSQKWLGSSSIHTQLISGKSELISVKPALLLDKIIRSIHQENLWSTINTEASKTIWGKCLNGHMGNTGLLIREYIDQFGSRSVGELKLESKTFETHPELLIEVIKSYEHTPENEFRFKADDINEVRLSRIKKIIYNYVLRKAIDTVADRENLRFVRTLAFGVVRKMIRSIGEKLVATGHLEKLEDIFYFSEDEVSSLVNQRMTESEARLLIAERKKTFSSYQEIKHLPERIHEVDGWLDLESDHMSMNSSELTGIPCSPGIVTGNIRVLENANGVKSLEGDILATTSTDPGWITIFRSASAILVERGSTLSHAAIVSREMGIPCIVGIKGLTQKLKTGNRIELNAYTGQITILS